MKYEDILNKIVDIIELSEQKKEELETKEIFENNISSPNDKNFFVFNPYYIYKDYYDNFEKLRNQELTYHLLKTDKYAALKNQSLVRECYKLIESDIANKEDYEKVINIINGCNGKKAEELSYIGGYFICKDDLSKFKELCNKYKIGIGVKINNDKDKVLDLLENSKKQVADQKLRIQNHINKLKNEFKDEKAKNISNKSDVSIVNDNLKSGSISEINTILNCNYKEIIYLGMLGYLNSRMIVELKNIMTNNEYDELLKTLEKYNIFSHDELLNIELDVNEKINNVTNIDELVAYFAIKDNLNFETLKLLIPSIGIENYHYLVEQLRKFNVSNNGVKQSR